MSDLALHFLNKMKIMVVKEVEREEIEFICKVRFSASLFATCRMQVASGQQKVVPDMQIRRAVSLLSTLASM
jgi:hypothetical protein